MVYMFIVTVECKGQPQNWHVLAGIYSLDTPYLAEIPLLIRDMLVNFWGHPARNKLKKEVHAGIWRGIPT